MRFVPGLLPISDTMVAWLASKFCKPQKWSNKRAKCSSQSLANSRFLWVPLAFVSQLRKGAWLRQSFTLSTFNHQLSTSPNRLLTELNFCYFPRFMPTEADTCRKLVVAKIAKAASHEEIFG